MALFLKDDKGENEVHRASLRFLKTSVSFLNVDNVKGDLVESILNLFSLPE